MSQVQEMICYVFCQKLNRSRIFQFSNGINLFQFPIKNILCTTRHLKNSNSEELRYSWLFVLIYKRFADVLFFLLSFSSIKCAISHDSCTENAGVKVNKSCVLYLLQDLFTYKNLKIQMQYNSIFSNHRLKTWIQCNGIFQTTTNIGKTRDKYCLLSFMHRSKIGLLIPFAKINKRGGLNKEREGGEKI